MVSQEEALVRRVHEHGVVQLAAVAQPVGDAPDVVVDGRDAPQVVLHVPLVLPQRELVVGQPRRRLHLEVLLRQVVRDPHRGPPRRRRPRRVVVGEGRRHRDRVGVQVGVRRVRLPRPVRRLVPDQHAPRVVTVQRLEPPQRQVRDDVRRVAGLGAQAARGAERRVVVLPLVDQHVPVVEPLRVVAVTVAHVPLADHRGAVARVAQLRDERRLARVDRRRERRHAVHVAVRPREDGRPRRRAQRVRDVAPLQPHPARTDLVDPRCRVHHRPVRPDGVRGVVVGQHEHDVRSAGHGVTCRAYVVSSRPDWVGSWSTSPTSYIVVIQW